MFELARNPGRMPSVLLLLFVFVAGMASTELLVLGGRNHPVGEIRTREVTLEGKMLVGGHEMSFVPDGETDAIYVAPPGLPTELVEGMPGANFEVPAVSQEMRRLIQRREIGVRFRARGILGEQHEYKRGFGFGVRRNYPRMILVLELQRLVL